MQYLLLIYAEESPNPEPPDPNEMKAWGDYTAELRAAGVMVAGEALLPTSTATTVRVRDGETLTTDGPFAETKEVLGGFYILEVDDLDQALEWGAKCPGAPIGSIELRPIMQFDEVPS